MLYRNKYIPLHEAVQLIADRLVAANQQCYPDAVAAIEDARMQLLEALFEGAVHAEGVTADPTEPPAYEPPSIEYDNWLPIGRGVWLHERCEKGEDVYRLDAISVYWNDDYIDYFNSDGDWAEYIDRKIRLLCDDIDREFPALESNIQANPPVSGSPAVIYKTGVAGRPTSRDLAKQEMQRRADNGELCSSLAAEVRVLREWVQQYHPAAPQLTQSALQNALRDDYRRLKRSTPSSA